MALQGTLETFSVPEVLRLLSGTRKTGLLALDGDRGTAKVWMVDGTIAGARSDHEAEGRIPAVLFDLLRFVEGSFVFEVDAPFDGEPDEVDVDEALTEAEALVTEWRAIESVVPSMGVWVSMVTELADGPVTVTAEQWSALAIIGRGSSGTRVGDELGLGELDTCRRLRDLVDAGLVEVDDAPISIDPEPVATPAEPTTAWGSLGEDLAGFVAQASEEERSERTELSIDVAEPASVELDLDADPEPVLDEPAVASDDDVDEPEEWLAAEPSDETDETDETDRFDAAAVDELDTAEEAETLAVAEADPEATDEFLSQLANLSPKAAAAIEATASEEETAGRPKLPTGDADEEINRNLLLKFLSSAKH